MRRTLRAVGWLLLASLVTLALMYVVDDLSLRYRTSLGGDGPLQEVTFYYSTMLKNGRVEVFYGQPQTEVCVHALFPHHGHSPCWYVVRHTVRRIGLFTPGAHRGLT